MHRGWEGLSDRSASWPKFRVGWGTCNCLLGSAKIKAVLTCVPVRPQAAASARQPTDPRHQAQQLARGRGRREGLVPRGAPQLGGRGQHAVQVVGVEHGAGRGPRQRTPDTDLPAAALGRWAALEPRHVGGLGPRQAEAVRGTGAEEFQGDLGGVGLC